MSDSLKRQEQRERERVERIEAARGFVTDVLRRYRRQLDSRGVKASTWHRDESFTEPNHHERSVPTDRVCWTIDVARALLKVDRELGPGLGELLLDSVGRIPPLEAHAAAKRLNIPAMVVERMVGASIWLFRAQFRPFGELYPHWKDVA
ncbi:MAG TPA: hypothetical protein VMO47_10535 [Rhodothermales bacterium]|nr:hypothetical protein [Rhodothermales bacterium]